MFADVSPNMQIAREEIFGPVLAVIPAEDTGDAIRITNSSKYGLSASVYTEDEDAAEKILDAIDAGLCHINLPTSFRDPSLPLLGWKDSGAGIPESGRFARDFFTKTKAIYRRKV
jgi:acyl-CoA reductase-like NAD-dependent aldehyde dehydrogenase